MIRHNRNVVLAPKQELLIVPFSDIQSEEEYPRLIRLVEWLNEKEAGGAKVLTFGVGDYGETPAPSDRAALDAAKRGFKHYDDLRKQIDQAYLAKTDEIIEILYPIRHTVMGLLKGHHFHEFSGLLPEHPIKESTDEYLARDLGTVRFGTTVAITISINGLPFRIFAAHGYGSARTPGARLTKRIRMRDVYGQANWYVMGHDDEKVVYPLEAILPDGTYLKQYFSGSGSFQNGYKMDEIEGGYIEELLLPPAAKGVVICRLVHEERDGKGRLDYHIST